jgi:hypothetical protein
MQVRIYVNIAYVEPTLMLIDIVNFSEIKNGLSFINSQIFLTFIFFLVFHLLQVLAFFAKLRRSQELFFIRLLSTEIILEVMNIMLVAHTEITV